MVGLMGRLDLVDKSRDEDGFTLWTTDASRAIARGDYAAAIAVLLEAGHDALAAERFVAVTLAVNTPRPIQDLRLAFLVNTARAAMEQVGWTFALVARTVELAQSPLAGGA